MMSVQEKGGTRENPIIPLKFEATIRYCVSANRGFFERKIVQVRYQNDVES